MTERERRTRLAGLFTVLMARGGVLFLAMATVGVIATPASAQKNTRPAGLREVEFEQKVNRQVPLELYFRDEQGNRVQLARYFNQKPVILNFVYYQCQDLCPLLLDGIVRSLRGMSFVSGNQFAVLTVSIDPHDTPAIGAMKKLDIMDRYGRPGAAKGWHFLTGDEAAIRRLTQAVGFRYTYDRSTGGFAHAAGIVLLTPEGKTSRYFYGIDFSPRDLRLALIEAAANKIGSPIDQLLLFCYHYDPAIGKYTLLVNRIVQIAGAATVLAIGAFITVMLVREHRSRIGGSA